MPTTKQTQFEKRKAKAAVDVTPAVEAVVAEFVEPVVLQPGDQPQQVLPHFAYDVFLDPSDNRTYRIVTIKYDPVSRAAIVTEVKPIGRNIGLSHDHQKRALSALKDR